MPLAISWAMSETLALMSTILLHAFIKQQRVKAFILTVAMSLAFYALKEAKEGGDSMLASSVTAYNEIAKRRPDLVPALFEPVATDRRGEVPDGQDPFFMIPVFTWHEGYLTCLYQRNYINSAQRFDQAPKLTPQQKAGPRSP